MRVSNVRFVVNAGTMLTCGKDNVLKVLDMRTFEERAALGAPGFAVGAVWTNACLGPDELHAAAGAPPSQNMAKCFYISLIKSPSQECVQ